MTKIITALMVGGPEHGKQYKMNADIRNFRIDVADFDVPLKAPEEIDPLSEVPYHTEFYLKETLNFFGHYVSVFFHESLTDNGTADRHRLRGIKLGELLLNDTAKQLLSEGAS